MISLPLIVFSQISFDNPLTINTQDGLPENEITALAEDWQGFAWLGTKSGLVKTDGLSIELFQHDEDDSTSLSENYIIEILPDEERNKIWVATTNSLYTLDLKTKQFKKYRYQIDNIHSVRDHRVVAIMKDRSGDIWIGFKESGIVKYRPETDDFQRYICIEDFPISDEPLCNYSIVEIEEDLHEDHILWLGTQKGIIKFNKLSGSYDHFYYSIPGEIEREKFVNAIKNMIVHPNGYIYTGSWYFGLTIFDTKTNKYFPFNPCYLDDNRPFAKDVTNGFFLQSENELWVCSRKGLQLYDLKSQCITKTYINNLKKGLWYSIDNVDAKGRIWSASLSTGFHIYDPLLQQYENLFYEDIESKYSSLTRKIIEDTIRQKLYVGVQATRGLFIYDLVSKSWDFISAERTDFEGYKEELNIWSLIQFDDGSILVIDDGMLYWYKQGDDRLIPYPVQPPEFPRLRYAIKGRGDDYWISGYNAGLMKLDHKNKTIEYIDKTHLKEKWNRIIGGDHLCIDKNGNIWMREHNGLFIYQTEIDSSIYIPYDSKNVKAYPGMGSLLALKNGEVWISSNTKFLAYAHADSMEHGILKTYGRESGLIGDHVYLTHKYHNKLLVFTDVGMQEFDLNTRMFRDLYDAEYGLGRAVSNITELSSGELAAGRTKYISLFHPDSLTLSKEIPKPYISSFKVFNKNIPIDPDIYSVDSIFLSHRENFFTIEMSALGYTLPRKTNFRYKLEGFDEKWQDGTKRHFAAYTNVPGGDYRFIIESFNEDGNNTALSSVTYLFVSTVWWKTEWFWILLIMFIASMVYFIYKYNTNQIRKEERLRSDYERKLNAVEMSALRAQMNPHFIFNSLNSIEYYIINNEPEKASDYLNRFSRLIRLILQNSKSSRVTLKDDLEALKLYIEMESMRFNRLFDYEVRVESGISLEKIEIPPMLMQPYVENAIWHGLMQKKDGKGKLDLTVRGSNGYLICYIEDNGIGRDAATSLKSKSATRRKSYGMKITSDRLSMLNKLAGANASVKVFDKEDQKGKPVGTKVELTIPILQPQNQTNHDQSSYYR